MNEKQPKYFLNKKSFFYASTCQNKTEVETYDMFSIKFMPHFNSFKLRSPTWNKQKQKPDAFKIPLPI